MMAHWSCLWGTGRDSLIRWWLAGLDMEKGYGVFEESIGNWLKRSGRRDGIWSKPGVLQSYASRGLSSCGRDVHVGVKRLTRSIKTWDA